MPADSVEKNRDAAEHAAYLEAMDNYDVGIERVPEILFLIHFAKELGFSYTYQRGGPHLVQTLFNKHGDNIQIALIQAGQVNIETGMKSPSFFGFQRLVGRLREDAEKNLAKSFGGAEAMSVPESLRKGQYFDSTYLDRLLARLHEMNPGIHSHYGTDQNSRRAPRIINDQEPQVEGDTQAEPEDHEVQYDPEDDQI